MEKKQYDLCFEILRRFHKAGILNDLILIGSWCVYFYKDYFASMPYIDHIALRTRDVDFLIDNPSKIKKKVDVFKLLEDLRFVVDFKASHGYIKLDHPDLVVEFLVPERGKRGSDVKRYSRFKIKEKHYVSKNLTKTQKVQVSALQANPQYL